MGLERRGLRVDLKPVFDTGRSGGSTSTIIEKIRNVHTVSHGPEALGCDICWIRKRDTHGEFTETCRDKSRV